MSECTCRESCDRLVDGKLSSDELVQLETHLDGCQVCRVYLDEVFVASAGGRLDTLRRPTPAKTDLPPEVLSRLLVGVPTWLPKGNLSLPSGKRFQRMKPLRRNNGEALQGGQGRVSIACDTELNREVAIKEPHESASPGLQSRFLVEAEITGRLEHPGVVPVYGLGQHSDGRPFYATRLIVGESLAEAVQRLHDPAERVDSDARRFTLRGLLGRFIQACNTVAFAHSRGVVHRDLKPEHVMLGPYGETFVIDWGLAKPISDGTLDVEREAPRQVIVPGFDRGTTLPGGVFGTPAYMSPEQATAHGEQVGPASDIYSLGATLYYLLTGRDPVGMSIDTDDHHKACGGSPRPRTFDPSVSKALEAVCIRAMAFSPDDRYPSVVALAEDVERWLAGEPVSAYREPIPARVGRWVRRRRMRLFLTTATCTVFVIGLVATLAVGAARERAHRVEQEAAILNALRSEAEAASLEADQKRLAAERAQMAAKRDRYISDIRFAGMTWAANDIAQFTRLLERHQPRLDEPNFLGFEWYLLDKLRRTEMVALAGHTDGVINLTFSPDGEKIASRSWDKTMRVWELATGRTLFSFPVSDAYSDKENAEEFNAAKFTPDGKRLVLSTFDGTQILDAATGQKVETPILPRTNSIAFSSDGKRVFGVSGNVWIWDTTTRNIVWWVPQKDGNLAEVRNENYKPEHFKLHVSDGGAQIAYSADGRSLVVADMHKFTVLDVATRHVGAPTKYGDSETGAQVGTRKSEVVAVAMNSTGDRLATASTDEYVRIWNTKTGELHRKLQRHGRPRNIAFSPDGRSIAAATTDGIIVWDATTTSEVLVFRGEYDLPITGNNFPLAFGPDSLTLAAADCNQKIRLWDLTREPESYPLLDHHAEITALNCASNGRWIVAGDLGGTVAVVDALTGNVAHSFTALGPVTGGVGVSPNGKWVVAACRVDTLGPNRDLMNLGGQARELRVWDTTTGEAIIHEDGQSGNYSVSLSPDGTRLAATDGTRLRVLALPAGRETWSEMLPIGTSEILLTTAFSPNGKLVAFGSNNGKISIRDAATGAELQLLDGLRAAVLGLVFDRKSELLASRFAGPDGNQIALWDLTTGRQLRTFKGGNAITDITISPDCSRLVAAERRRLRFWDIVTGEELFDLPVRSIRSRLVFTPDGRSLVMGGDDGRVRNCSVGVEPPISVHRRRGIDLAELGRWAAASAEFERAASAGADDHSIACYQALTRLGIFDWNGFQRARSSLIRRFGNATAPSTADEIAWTCVAIPGTIDWSPVIRLSETAVKATPANHGYLQTLGAALYRAGRPKEAIERFNEAVQAAEDRAEDGFDLLYLAAAHNSLGRKKEAKAFYERGVEWARVHSRGGARGRSHPPWLPVHFVQLSEPHLGWDSRVKLVVLHAEVALRLELTDDASKPLGILSNPPGGPADGYGTGAERMPDNAFVAKRVAEGESIVRRSVLFTRDNTSSMTLRASFAGTMMLTLKCEHFCEKLSSLVILADHRIPYSADSEPGTETLLRWNTSENYTPVRSHDKPYFGPAACGGCLGYEGSASRSGDSHWARRLFALYVGRNRSETSTFCYPP
jgi:eukaryotic-like serine/threonine-protein kinase